MACHHHDISATPLDFLEFIECRDNRPLSELLERILLKARHLTDAESGTIFLVRNSGKKKFLEPGTIQNDRVKLEPTNFRIEATPASAAGYVATTGETLFIDDLYNIPADLPFTFNRSFDQHTGYRSLSMLAFPLTNTNQKVVAVVQLLNRSPEGHDRPLPFEREHAALIAPVNHFAGRAIERAAMTESILKKNARLREQRKTIAALNRETEDAFRLSVTLLARAAELHDEDTGNHIVRVNEYAYLLARAAGQPKSWCDAVRYSAQLHDVGKMSIDAAVLKKKGRLTEEEWREMRRHAEYGHRILKESPRLRMAADIALCHHEKWDGTGYPQGLTGKEIPLAARIVAIADIYDALRSPRSYKPGLSHEETCHIILHGDERIVPQRHFDPALLNLVSGVHAAMDEVWNALRDLRPEL